MAKKAVSEAPDVVKENPKVRVRVPQSSGVKLEGFDTAMVGKEATLTIVGKVVEIRSITSENEWDNGKTLELELKHCTVDGPGGDMGSLDDALAAAAKKVD